MKQSPWRFMLRSRLSLAALAVVLLGWLPSRLDAHLRAASLLARAAGEEGRIANLYRERLLVEEVRLQSEHGTFPARVYRPADGRQTRAVILSHGVHYRGYDEPRLLPFARSLAAAGYVVLTPHHAALADYTVARSTIDEMRSSVRWLRAQPYVAPGGVGFLGLSFAGGLSLVAAGENDVRNDVAFVLSVGGHHDLRRVLRFLATDELVMPDGVRRMHAHDYGLLVFFYAWADQLVPAEQREPFRAVLREMLRHDRQGDRSRVAELSGPTRELFDRIDRNDKEALRPIVERALAELDAPMRSLSPVEQLHRLRAPVFLLHGANDDVMPPTEPEMILRELADRGSVRAVISRAVKHVTVEGRPDFHDTVAILRLMADALGP